MATKRVLTAVDVRRAAESGQRELPVPRGQRITPLARDVARELGVELTTGAPAAAGSGDALESQVRGILAAMLGAGGGGTLAAPGAVPVRHVDAREVRLEPFPHAGPGQEAMAVDVVTGDHGSPMAAGFLTLTRGSFPWTLTYDEVQYVIEGELHIGTSGGTVVGRPGDVLYVPKGTSITFGTPSWARFLYVTYPANWETAS